MARQDLKLKYYELMIQHALHHDSYLDVAKYYEKVWETPSIKDDVRKNHAVGASSFVDLQLFDSVFIGS